MLGGSQEGKSRWTAVYVKRLLSPRQSRGITHFIYLYYAKQNPYAAERIIIGVDEKFRLLSRHPLLGRERLELGSGVRGILSGSHVILYSVKADRLTILRVIDGRMDIEAEFNG